MSSAETGVDRRHGIREALRLLKPFWPLSALGTGIGILSGLATAGLLATVNRGLHDAGATPWQLLAGLAGLGILSVGGTAIAGALNSIVGQRLIAALRKDISARILRTPIATLEAHRPHRLMAVLTSDVEIVSIFTFNFSGYAIALAISIGSFAYLAALSPPLFAIALVWLVLTIGINIVAKRGWIRDYKGVRVAQDDLQKQYRAITEGAKELKISRPRRGRVHGVLLADAADRIAALKSRAMRLYWLADAAGSGVFFAVIGVLLAARHQLGIDAAAVSGAVIVLLYVKGPISQLAGALPMLDQAQISFGRIAALSAELDQGEATIGIPTGDKTGPAAGGIRSIALRGVTYAFPRHEGAEPFALGPIDLTIRAGELVFIVGDNGSGKTTLVKLLLGLYAPQGGAILRDGEPVTAATRDDYRQIFTTIFSDYYLFDDLAYGALPQEAQPHLDRLGMSDKVRVEDGRFSTTDLSSGQRKRLALVHAYLEKRPVIVTDEWAADQDPGFRRTFYEELLPALQAQGRTLIVVSHDDRYFHIADRIVRLAGGRIVEDQPMQRPMLVRGAP
ncbi:cyclic peptide export ABC transporter [Chelatococcus reniformis]|uniref:Pyoverdine biosynthesis protein PvdE n=1 Tax=Chelatococcus reniformis TaxID=1494448 RepID=A0A916UUW0_9HYPH|nr:cyclic peptide export ABC transporter [Chelatococcus reniformis]GGC89033.1 pyoverdine biosynthesis protein PvdE [Chelatococcus reniformis]